MCQATHEASLYSEIFQKYSKKSKMTKMRPYFLIWKTPAKKNVLLLLLFLLLINFSSRFKSRLNTKIQEKKRNTSTREHANTLLTLPYPTFIFNYNSNGALGGQLDLNDRCIFLEHHLVSKSPYNLSVIF